MVHATVCMCDVNGGHYPDRKDVVLAILFFRTH